MCSTVGWATHVVVIGEGEDKDRINRSPRFFHFKNQQSSLDNHQAVAGDARGLARHRSPSAADHAVPATCGEASRVLDSVDWTDGVDWIDGGRS